MSEINLQLCLRAKNFINTKPNEAYKYTLTNQGMRGVTYQKKSKQNNKQKCLEFKLEVEKLNWVFWEK